MDIRRFYTEPQNVFTDRIILMGEECNHIVNVMRYKVNYKLIIFCGDGYDYNCTIASIDKKTIICAIDSKTPNDRSLPVKVHLYLATLKSDKMDMAIQKACELGVTSITPMVTKRNTQNTCNIERSKRIIIESCKQCERSDIPLLNNSKTFSEVVSTSVGDKLMAYENERDYYALRAFKAMGQEVSILIGPEGGFETEEVEEAVRNGFKTFTLGKRILRAETAVISVLSGISLITEDK